jgi:hypothetical protein
VARVFEEEDRKRVKGEGRRRRWMFSTPYLAFLDNLL